MVLLLFFCSGATALIYEVIWSKYLALMFGSTVQAQTVVLAVFMGGLALGNKVFGTRSGLLAHPLKVYGFLELAIGFYAFFFASLFGLADFVFVALGARILDHSSLLLLLKALLSVALLLPPTLLMGGTLPLLVAWLEHRSTDASRWSARFYSVNSLGAVFGSWLAGFVLVRFLGMVATLQLVALLNIIIGFTAMGLSRTARLSATAPIPSAGGDSSLAPTIRSGVVLVSLTGAVSMGLEVLASRSLALIFGSSLQAFAIVLMAFISGIGLGSAWIASPRRRNWRNPALLIFLLLGTAAVLAVLIANIESLVNLYRHVRTGLARTEMGFRFHQVFAGLLSLLVLGLPAAMLGAVLPHCIRCEDRSGTQLAKKVGQLLTWNTLGAVAGVLITGFVLMPRLGLRNAFAFLAMVLCVTAGILALQSRQKKALLATGFAAAILIVAWTATGEGWRHVLSSGVFRARETVVSKHTMELRRKHIQIRFYEDAADATVSVEEGDGIGAPADMGLRINGKPEASTKNDMCTQLLISHLPMLARPDSTDVFLLGFGSGISAGAMLGHPITRLVVAENCQPVIRAGVWFKAWNRGVLTNPVAKIWNEDARTILKLSPQLYDIIISQPSNPWMAGVGSVFSREFYELAAKRLKPGGIMVQWFHIYEVHDQIVNMVLRTFGSVFPSLEIWDSGSGDIILLGSARAWPSSPTSYARVFERPVPRQDLQMIGFDTPEALWSRQFASQKTASAIAGPGVVQSDFFPLLEYEAPKAFYIGAPARQLIQFDERTWEGDLASPEKQRTLGSLDQALLKRAFANATVNPELADYLRARFRNRPAPETSSTAPLPSRCLFFPESRAEPMVQGEPVLDSLLAAELGLRRDDQFPEAIKTIQQALQQALQTRRTGNTSPVYFAAEGIRVSLARKDFRAANALLQMALSVEPGDPQLLYLQRVLQRQETENPK